MRFEWERIPEIVADLRAQAVIDLIGAADHNHSQWVRGRISAYDEILRLPADQAEDLFMKEEIGYER